MGRVTYGEGGPAPKHAGQGASVPLHPEEGALIGAGARPGGSETRSPVLGLQQRLGVGTDRLDFAAAPVAFGSRLAPSLEERCGVGCPQVTGQAINRSSSSAVMAVGSSGRQSSRRNRRRSRATARRGTPCQAWTASAATAGSNPCPTRCSRIACALTSPGCTVAQVSSSWRNAPVPKGSRRFASTAAPNPYEAHAGRALGFRRAAAHVVG